MRFLNFTLHNCNNESESTLLIYQIVLSHTAYYNFFIEQNKNIATIRMVFVFRVMSNE